MVTVPSRRNPHTSILPSSHRAQQEKKTRTREPGPKKQAKDRDTHQGGGREKVHAREEGGPTKSRGKGNERRERLSKGREQGRGHSKHTASTGPQQSTREGGTRGTDEERHHAPRHAPHRHHTRRTHPHPRPQRVATGPWQPAQRAGSREGGAPEPRRPPPPPWRPAPRRAREPRGQCRAPTPPHLHPQHVDGGPRQPAWRVR